jgi:DivIVA domain-containing protein
MTDTSGTSATSGSSPAFAARDARLTPESVAERTFTQVKRGYAESEVRAFLRMVSDDLLALRNRDRELTARLQELEDRLARPAAPPSDQDLIAALGEETARVLGQARQSAIELRTKAEEHARKVVREAQESARELRLSTQQAVETKTREAEEAARNRAREIVNDARQMRERVLTDLSERRTELERQINELRANRGRFAELYQVVERALAQVQRTIADEPPVPSSPAPAAAPGGDADAADEHDDQPSHDAPPAADAPPEPAVPPASDATEEPRDVGALFERLRSGSAPEPGDVAAAAPALDPDTDPRMDGSDVEVPGAAADDGAPSPEDDGEPTEAEEPVGSVDTDVVSVDEIVLDDESLDPDDAARAARDDALGPISEELAHRAKRALQDEQNDMLDGLRRQRGKIDAGKVLPAADGQLSRWADVLGPSVDRAYAAGTAVTAPGGEPVGAVPAPLLSELAGMVVTPLRGRLETSLSSIDAKSPADVEIAIAQRVGARYREWRSQGLEDALGDALAVAYTQGAYDAAPDGARLRWIPARVGKCPDCDDNALEPTTKGDEFPTGQLYPPAHPGCRCLVVIATD